MVINFRLGGAQLFSGNFAPPPSNRNPVHASADLGSSLRHWKSFFGLVPGSEFVNPLKRQARPYSCRRFDSRHFNQKEIFTIRYAFRPTYYRIFSLLVKMPYVCRIVHVKQSYGINIIIQFGCRIITSTWDKLFFCLYLWLKVLIH